MAHLIHICVRFFRIFFQDRFQRGRDQVFAQLSNAFPFLFELLKNPSLQASALCLIAADASSICHSARTPTPAPSTTAVRA
mmetsp:Transcript_5530/g.19244  ORF Transcript_5530/g.19244 Transcript_5530/m.19244 type:complete len:81 (-) Transcript_5530:1060-1302(-)